MLFLGFNTANEKPLLYVESCLVVEEEGLYCEAILKAKHIPLIMTRPTHTNKQQRGTHTSMGAKIL